MNFLEAIEKAKEGHAFWSKSLKHNIYFIIQSPCMTDCILQVLTKEEFDEDNLNHCSYGEARFSVGEIELTDWEIYERPEK